MQKKVMALAVAGALAAPAALAQVQIGGGIHLQYYLHDGDNPSATKDGTDVLSTSEPEIYIRGEEKLGGGLSVWFQCTSSFDVLGTGSIGASAGWCGRNSAIGFRGDFGNIFAGAWDTPQKLVFQLGRGWWGATNTLQGGTGVILLGGSQTAGNTGTSFHRRQMRSVNYHSPDWSGFTLQAAFSAANESLTLADSSPLDPRLMSVAGQFRTGPFFAGLGYEQHKDFTSVGGSDKNITATVGFTFAGAIRVSGTFVSNEYKPDVGSTLEYDGFAVYVDWTLGGPHKLYFQYGDRGENDVAGATVTNTGAQVMGVAYGYSFSKRTQGYIAYNELKNDDAAAFSFGTAAPTAGGKNTAIGIGLRHSF